MIDWLKLREDFPILRRQVHGKPLVYLDNAATSQKPRAVIDALVDFYSRHNANIHRGVHTLSDEATQLVDDARLKTAAFIKAPGPENIMFTRNATESINLVAYAWGRKFISANDEILLTEMEHHSNLVPWQILAAERSAHLRFVPMTPEGTLDLEVAARLITPQTKLLALTACSNALGTLNPVPELISLAQSVGAKTLIDACQWAPHFPIDVRSWDCDFLAFSAHKMLGPTGIGVLYGKQELLSAMNPFLGGGDMIEEVFLDHSTYNTLPFKFEAGTPNIADTVAFGTAIDYLSHIGFDAVRDHELALTRYALEKLRADPRIVIYGPQDSTHRGGIISFNIHGVHSHDVGTALDLSGIAVRVGHHCCQPMMRKLGVGSTVRASFYIYNTTSEIDALVAAVRKTADFFVRA